jgi:hypothetical protein
LPFEGSYLWHLRQKVGHDLVLMPGTADAAQREDGRVLFAVSNATWSGVVWRALQEPMEPTISSPHREETPDAAR